uniref:Uncharacterized protein n=1 Tax=Oryza rufipogon TaxID=4529 RepID=A0A0E0P3R0_ORYRU
MSSRGRPRAPAAAESAAVPGRRPARSYREKGLAARFRAGADVSCTDLAQVVAVGRSDQAWGVRRDGGDSEGGRNVDSRFSSCSAGMVFARGNGTACRVSRGYLYSCSLDGLLAGKPNMIAGAGGHKDEDGRKVKLPANVAVGKSVFRRRRAAGEMYAGAGPSAAPGLRLCVGGWLRSRCWNLELEAPIEMGIRRMASRDHQHSLKEATAKRGRRRGSAS